jgi:hypothetical protein
MRPALATTLFCTALSVCAHAADGGVWQWQAPMSFPQHMAAMTASDLRQHIGQWVYAPDGSAIGSLDSFTTTNEAVVHGGMFFMGGMKYLVIPSGHLALMDGKLYVHDIDAAHVRKSMMPGNLVVGL